MAIKPIVFNQKNAAADTIEEFYTSPASGNGTRIMAFTASNDTESSKTYKAYIFASSGDMVCSVVPQTIVVKDRADNGSTSVNHVIPAGGTLRMESSDADSLNFYVTGNEQ